MAWDKDREIAHQLPSWMARDCGQWGLLSIHNMSSLRLLHGHPSPHGSLPQDTIIPQLIPHAALSALLHHGSIPWSLPFRLCSSTVPWVAVLPAFLTHHGSPLQLLWLWPRAAPVGVSTGGLCPLQASSAAAQWALPWLCMEICSIWGSWLQGDILLLCGPLCAWSTSYPLPALLLGAAECLTLTTLSLEFPHFRIHKCNDNICPLWSLVFCRLSWELLSDNVYVCYFRFILIRKQNCTLHFT